MDSLLETENLSLVRRLALTTQLYLPGTAGRIAHQVRLLEQVSQVFSQAGFVRKIHLPSPLSVHAGGIATEDKGPISIMGGFLYAVGALRLDLIVKDNQLKLGSQNSCCEVDDIDYEDQRLRLKLISIRQSYELASAALNDGEDRDLLIMDCPLLLSRSFAGLKSMKNLDVQDNTYDNTLNAIEEFWKNHQHQLFPWNPTGTRLVSVGSGRFHDLLGLVQRDLRDISTRDLIPASEGLRPENFQPIDHLNQAILSIGQKRFLQGLLDAYTRTVAYRVDLQSPQHEPSWLSKLGLYGFHFKSAQGTSVQFAQVVGSTEDWTSSGFDRLAALLMSLSTLGGLRAAPLPILLANRDLDKPLQYFLKNYSREVLRYLSERRLEEQWLADFDTLELIGD